LSKICARPSNRRKFETLQIVLHIDQVNASKVTIDRLKTDTFIDPQDVAIIRNRVVKKRSLAHIAHGPDPYIDQCATQSVTICLRANVKPFHLSSIGARLSQGPKSDQSFSRVMGEDQAT
jgi:hypothetical protein